ncbi:MAG: flagellin [Gammaproteobacteria bacterium]|jgi:flagellin
MALSVNTNVMSLNAQRNLSRTQTGLATAMERLSSGLRVNSAKDDAAGLAIASRMDAQVRGMNVAIRNAGDAISLAQTAEGGLNEITNMLQRMRELAVQSANATNSASDRLNLDAEYQALNTEITRQVGATRFNGVAIIGAGAGANVFQVGADATDTITVTTTTMAAAAPGTGITTDVLATAAIGLVDTALDLVTTNRATYGAVQNRFQSVINNLQVASENQSAARSRIMDADFAMETANMTRFQILQQAGTAMVAQANAAPQSVLSLLQ